ncbi:MAG: sugar kinase [Polaromonas sp.]|nr:sugar kinase [Polaromonas sp.]
MSASDNRKIVLITRQTRLQALVGRYQTLGQAKFYLEHLGADFSDYLREDAAYAASLRTVAGTLQAWGRHQVIDREHLSNYIFGGDDIVVALGPDGLVANTLKYLSGQPLLGVNPEPRRWDGVLLPFEPAQLRSVLPAVARGSRATSRVTMAEARLSDGQVLRAVNELFIGPKTHASALYDIEFQGVREAQSSSGLIVSTGMGSTAWLKSIITGSVGMAQAVGQRQGNKERREERQEEEGGGYRPMPWDASHLVFAVREPFGSRASQTTLRYGEISASDTLTLRSRMPENGVIFSDGMEADFLQFTAGIEARVGLCATQGILVK